MSVLDIILVALAVVVVGGLVSLFATALVVSARKSKLDHRRQELELEREFGINGGNHDK